MRQSITLQFRDLNHYSNSLSMSTKIGQEFCFLSVWIKISSGAMKWNYLLASSAPDTLRLAFICCVFILWQSDKWHGSISASTCYHWTPPLNKSHSLMLLGPISLHLPSTDVPPALLFFFPDRLMAQLLWEGLKISSNRQVPTQEAPCCFAFWRKWVRCRTFWCCYPLYSFCTGKDYCVRLSLCENCLL